MYELIYANYAVLQIFIVPNIMMYETLDHIPSK